MNVNLQWPKQDMVKRMSLTVQKAITATGKDEARRRAEGGHEGEAER